MTTKIARLRAQAFAHQQGHCYYCGVKMCLGDSAKFAKEHALTTAQARLLRCTAEHVIAQQDGGKTSSENIVAACFHCNSTRHRRRRAQSADHYRTRVQRAVARKRWIGPWIFKPLLQPTHPS